MEGERTAAAIRSALPASFRCNSFLHSALLHSALFLVVVHDLIVGVHHVGAGAAVAARLAAAEVAAHVGAGAGLTALIGLAVQPLADGVEGLRQLLGGALDGLAVGALQGLLQLAQGGLQLALVGRGDRSLGLV